LFAGAGTALLQLLSSVMRVARHELSHGKANKAVELACTSYRPYADQPPSCNILPVTRRTDQ